MDGNKSGPYFLRKAEGMVEEERRREDKPGTALTMPALAAATTAATAAANSVQNGWKVWREMTAFVLVCVLTYNMYRDFVRQAREDNLRLENAITNQTLTIQAALTGSQNRQDAMTKDVLATLKVMHSEHINQTNLLREDIIQDRKAMAKFVTVLERLDKKLGKEE